MPERKRFFLIEAFPKSQATIFMFYIYSDSSAEERKDQIYQQQPIYQGETLLVDAQGNVGKS